MTVEERFWAKVDIRDGDECWPWREGQAHLPQGYGLFRIPDYEWMQRSNRVAWRLTYGEIPDGQQVLHSCDNPPCCNPAHFFLGTNADNVADKVAKGRSSFPQPKKRGERHHGAKLTQAQVDSIRAESTGVRGEGKAFAERYGVSRSTICEILKGKLWAYD